MLRFKKGCIVGILLVAGFGTTMADAPRIVTFQVSQTFVSHSFSAFCGFEVVTSHTGPAKGILFYDRSGAAIIREIDTQPGFVVTVSSPASGRSFTFPFATRFHFDYPIGATPGAPAVVTAYGLFDKVPGIPADAGSVTYGNAKVLFLRDGVPIVDFGPPTAINGKENDLATAIAALCSALAP